jgi:GNAT superfamily N-acetyltransferase
MIRIAEFPQDTQALLDIWREFVASPSVSLAHQNNEAEFAALPGKYAPPGGLVLLAEADGRLAGTVAMRRVDERICEMKRLYVRPVGRGRSLGRQLVARLIEEARAVGYAEMRLDVLAEFTWARALYREFGFTAAEPISYNPLPGTDFLGLTL